MEMNRDEEIGKLHTAWQEEGCPAERSSTLAQSQMIWEEKSLRSRPKQPQALKKEKQKTPAVETEL